MVITVSYTKEACGPLCTLLTMPLTGACSETPPGTVAMTSPRFTLAALATTGSADAPRLWLTGRETLAGVKSSIGRFSVSSLCSSGWMPPREKVGSADWRQKDRFILSGTRSSVDGCGYALRRNKDGLLAAASPKNRLTPRRWHHQHCGGQAISSDAGLRDNGNAGHRRRRAAIARVEDMGKGPCRIEDGPVAAGSG